MRRIIRTGLHGLLVLICIAGCGGRTADDYRPVTLEQSSQLACGGELPAFGDLPAVARELSLAGPGWYDLDLASAQVLQNAALNGAVLELTPTADQPAYALFGVGRFDGDNGPTSARVTLDEISGEYWVAFADFIGEHWEHVGPLLDSATVEIPTINDYIRPPAFTDENGNTYLAVIAPPGSTATLGALELGVDGGSAGPPAPGPITSISGGATAVVLHWEHSASHLDPDFAGYWVRRAPRMYGDYTELCAEPFSDPYYVDETITAAESYRYQIYTIRFNVCFFCRTNLIIDFFM